MVNINYCPLRMKDEMYYDLIEKEIKYHKLSKSKYKDIPEFYVAGIDEYDFEEDEKKSFELTIEAYKRFPEHFIVKRNYYYRMIEQEEGLNFESFFAKEFDCFENGKDYGRVVSDEEMISMVELIGTYYYEKREHQKLVDLYNKLECSQNPDLLLYTAVYILKKDILNYSTIFYNLDENVSDWLLELDLPNSSKDVYYEPKNPKFYKLLNVEIDSFKLIDVDALDHLSNYEEIKHDIIWLLKQGIQRSTSSDSIYKIDYFIYALYLTAAYEVKELYTYFFKLFLDATDDARELLYGDFPNIIVAPALMKIFNGMSEEDFDPLFNQDESNWYSKSVYFNIIASLQVHNGPTHFSFNVLKNLFKYYDENNDFESLTWLVSAMEDTNCKGFEAEIDRAFKEEKLDTSITGTQEEWMEIGPLDFLTPKFNLFSEYLNYFDVKLLKEDNVIKDFYEDLQNFISQFEVDEEIYSEEDDYFDSEEEEDDYFDSEKDTDNIIPLWQNVDFIKRTEPKIGRNDPCPCGSGKKYKKCCGA